MSVRHEVHLVPIHEPSPDVGAGYEIGVKITPTPKHPYTYVKVEVEGERPILMGESDTCEVILVRRFTEA